MFSWLRNWGPGKIAASWTVYWIALGTATLWTPVQQALRLSQLGDGHSSISAGFQNTLFQLAMTEDGRSVYNGSAYLITIVLWLTVPPLLLWFAWLKARPDGDKAEQNKQPTQQLSAGDDGFSARPIMREPEKSPQRNSADRN